jgi:hypothetical protein
LLKYTVILLVVAGIYLCHIYLKKEPHSIKFIYGQYIDSHFIILQNSLHKNGTSEIIFSLDPGNYFRLIKYKNGIATKFLSGQRDYFYPFLATGENGALYDSLGDEKFKTNLNELDFFSRRYNGTFRKIYSSKKGKFIITLLNNDNNIYFLDLINKTVKIIGQIQQKLNSVVFADHDKYVIISYDNHLVYYSITKDRGIELLRNILSPKLNPSIHNDDLYFVMNDTSEYYQIYKLRLPKKFPRKPHTGFNKTNYIETPELVKRSNHDLRLPSVWNNYLYFISIIRNEYLLKRENLLTQKEEFLTTKGVVYNYKFFQNDKLVMAYSNFNTPRNLIIYNLKSHNGKNISGTRTKLNIKYRYIGKSQNLSPAYLFESNDSTLKKGIILFIHPGLHSDFSPRWDNTLMNLIRNGYILIAPNYPMSCGLGKTYKNEPLSAAVNDIEYWESFIKKNFSDQPLYLLSFSSGNVIMETVLRDGNNGVKAAVSIFGIPGDYLPGFSIPVLYMLGKNDPLVNYRERDNILEKSINMGYNIKILTFDKEGHWFRKAVDIKHCVNSIITFYSQN